MGHPWEGCFVWAGAKSLQQDLSLIGPERRMHQNSTKYFSETGVLIKEYGP